MTDTAVKRRLRAILAADAAGFSRLMAEDEQATVIALDAARTVFRTAIEAHQGRVIDMAGDSVLAVFETATGAVSAALAIQQELGIATQGAAQERRMHFRIGVHPGDVIEKHDGTIYGDGVNVAARLEGLATPGGITVSDAVRGVVGGRVGATFTDQGEQQLKDIAGPIRAFAIRLGAAASKGSAAGGADVAIRPAPAFAAVLPEADAVFAFHRDSDAERRKRGNEKTLTRGKIGDSKTEMINHDGPRLRIKRRIRIASLDSWHERRIREGEMVFGTPARRRRAPRGGL